MAAAAQGSAPAHDVATALCLFAVDPEGTGLVLRGRAGPVRDRVVDLLRNLMPERSARRMPLGIADDRLLGGLDLAATLRAGRPVAQRGLLAEVDGGLLVVPMAERLAGSTAARLTAVLDEGALRLERDGIALVTPARFGAVLLDEGAEPDERPPMPLLDRMAFLLDLEALNARDEVPLIADPGEIAAARDRLRDIAVPDGVLVALCTTALALGVMSLRAPLLALAAARAAAALTGCHIVSETEAVLAARLVLGPRATVLPEARADEAEPPERPRGEDGAVGDPPALDEVVLSAALAAIPAGLLARLTTGGGGRQGGKAGRAGAPQSGAGRGRPAGMRRGRPCRGARLNVIETVRMAAPWQMLRRQEARRLDRPERPFDVRPEDMCVTRLKQRARSTTIFIVDASGSAAFQRLAEAKGAVELLLAEAYVRRDQVALVSFRGARADILLPPTRSLVRAKRSLASLPGGGGTPLAAGLDAGAALAEAARRRGETPTLVVLSDGRANVARDGIARRERAEAEATGAARDLRLGGVSSLFIDTSPRPEPAAHRLADAMGAFYLPLPRADAQALSRAVRAVVEAGG